MKKFHFILVLAISLLALTGCFHKHTFSNADCTSPKTCTGCGETEGVALGHTWTEATCTAPKTCKACHATEGSALGHDWKDATCTAPKTCKTCNATEGSALGHDWKGATCTTPKTCKTCHATEGSALGHAWKEATCTEPKKCTNCNATSGSALGHTTIGLNCSKCGVSTVVCYDDFPGVPDLGAMFGTSADESSDGKYSYYLKDVGGSTGLNQYISTLTAAGFSPNGSYSLGSDTIRYYINKQSGMKVSIVTLSTPLGKYVQVTIEHT